MPNDLKRIAVDAARLAAPIFKANGWTYGGALGMPNYVPDEAELATTILSLIEHAGREDSSGRVGSGRFWVNRFVDETETPHVHVTLELAMEWKSTWSATDSTGLSDV